MIKKIIAPVIKVNKTAIIGTKIFINVEGWLLTSIDGRKLNILMTTH